MEFEVYYLLVKHFIYYHWDFLHLKYTIIYLLLFTFSKPGFSNMWTVNFLMFKLVLEKAEEPEIKLPTSAASWKKQESSRKNIYLCFIDYAKAFDCVDHNKLWKILKEMGIPDHLTCLLRSLYVGQEATVNWTWNNILVPNRKRSMSRYHKKCLLYRVK